MQSTAGAGQEAFGDGSDRLALNLGPEAQQLDRGDLVEPFALHDGVAGLLDTGVMPTLDPMFAALNPGVLPARERSAHGVRKFVHAARRYSCSSPPSRSRRCIWAR